MESTKQRGPGLPHNMGRNDNSHLALDHGGQGKAMRGNRPLAPGDNRGEREPHNDGRPGRKDLGGLPCVR